MDRLWDLFSRQAPEPMPSDSYNSTDEPFDDTTSGGLEYGSSNNFEEAFLPAEDHLSDPNFLIDPQATILSEEPNSSAQENLQLQLQPSSDSTSPTQSFNSSESPREHKRKDSSGSDCSTASGLGRPMVDALPYQDNDFEKNLTTISGARDSAVALNPTFNTLTLDADVSAEQTMAQSFDFESASSSPSGLSRSLHPSQIMTEQPNVVPVTLRPRRFFLESREPSPARIPIPQELQATPNLFGNNEHSDNMGLLSGDPPWDNLSGNMSWTPDMAQSSLLGPDIVMPPNPVTTSVPVPLPVPVPASLPVAEPLYVPPSNSPYNNVRFHIDPIAPKSRVETQINIVMTLSPIPAGITKLHLPTQSVSKAKLLAKSVEKLPDTLELHTMLVCTSAMEKEEVKERTLRRARGEAEISSDAVVQPPAGNESTEEKDEGEKPTEGGEVRICQNCINRERKRAARKKPKNEDEEDRWYSYENDRVIVFNTTEYKEWQPCPFGRDALASLGSAAFNAGSSMQIEVPMRIACYCRHQGEKIGFRVIFTIKDYKDNLVAQQWTDSILITDDHKTQVIPPNINTSISLVDPSQIVGPAFSPISQDNPIPTFHRRPYYSTTDLQSLQGTHPRFLPRTTYANIPNSVTKSSVEPPGYLNRSREASPSAQMGPKKKRKSSPSPHRKFPSSLAMTPRVGRSRNQTATPLTATIFTTQDQMAAGISPLPNANMAPSTSPYSMYPAVLMVPNHAQVTSEPTTPNVYINGGGYNFENGFYPHQNDHVFLSHGNGFDRISRTLPPTPTGTTMGGFPHRSASVSNLPQQYYFPDMNAQPQSFE